MNKLSAILLLGIAIAIPVDAEIKLPGYITDNMVVQRNSVMKISGRARGDVSVSGAWLESPVYVAAGKDGKFSVDIPTPSAGGPYILTISDKDGSKKFHNVWSGEVWLCSGQSNMEMPVGGWGKVKDYEKEIQNASNPAVHLLQVKKATAIAPQEDFEVNMGGWRCSSPETVAEFSSIAYFYARELSRQLGVHVGVIDATWGGTPAEAWTPLQGVDEIAGFEEECGMLHDAGGSVKKMSHLQTKRVNEWNKMISGNKGKFNHSKYVAQARKVNAPDYIEKSIEGFDGMFVLQKEFEVPASAAGKELTLRLGMIDDEDITYFNGVEVGRTSGYSTPRTYTVPGKLVKPGKNLISIEVMDFAGEGGLYGKPSDVWAGSDSDRISLAGDWGCTVLADFSSVPPRPMSYESSSFPTVLYNAMISPLNEFPVKGTIWYQGCANVGRDAQYGGLMKSLISNWRKARNQEDMPFYFMQLAGYLTPREIQPDSQWAALRQAQTAACELDGVRYATAIDIGNPDDIHPKNKQEAARRFALIALNDAYGFKDVTAAGPAFKECYFSSGEAVVEFDSPVTVDGVAPAGFIARTETGEWVRPEISMEGSGKVMLKAFSPIKEVRYNWADYPDGNLRGFTGLPVAPFKAEVR